MKAIASFTRAAERDPGFALAQAGLAEAYTLAGGAGYGSLAAGPGDCPCARIAQKAIAPG